MEGWISLYRKIREHWIWKSNEPFDKRSAWVDILLRANHKNTKIMIDNKFVDIKAGSFITSEIKLSEDWKWSRKKVRNFLQGLEVDKMLSKKSTTKYTTITVENWGLYQIREQRNIQRKNNGRTTKEHRQ